MAQRIGADVVVKQRRPWAVVIERPSDLTLQISRARTLEIGGRHRGSPKVGLFRGGDTSMGFVPVRYCSRLFSKAVGLLNGASWDLLCGQKLEPHVGFFELNEIWISHLVVCRCLSPENSASGRVVLTIRRSFASAQKRLD
jgi:hypothetical protein